MFKKFTPLLISAAIILPLSAGAHAADWIEQVTLTKAGIDVVPIVVTANANGYGGVSTNSHRFSFHVFARATSGERIVAAKIGASHSVFFFEGSGGTWEKSYTGRAVGAGTLRTVSFDASPVVPVNKIEWQGADPRSKCEQNLATKRSQGMSKAAVLSKTWNVGVQAYFQLDAVAARKNKAVSGWNSGNTSDQRDGMTYPVSVTCSVGQAGGQNGFKAP